MINFLQDDDDDGGTVCKIKQLIDESDELKKEVEKYKELLYKKEMEMKRMEQEIERVQEIGSEQLSVIKDEIR